MTKDPSPPKLLHSLQSLAEWCLIPTILLATVLSNELTWTWGPMIGRIFGWAMILCASVIVTSAFRGKLWPLLLVIFVFISKAFQSLFGAETEGVTLSYYIIFYGLLMGIAAAVMMASRLNLVYKQLYVICFLNVIFMFMQSAGIADWSQFTTTHAQSDVGTYPVAFFNETSFFDISQTRPAGLLYSNQYLCIITLFGLVIHFSRKSDRFKAGTFVMCSMAVLSMSKLVFVGFILMSLYTIIAGTRYQKRSIVRAFALVGLLIGLYAEVFPGLFQSNLNAQQLIYSFSTRISSILNQYGADDLLAMLQQADIESQDTDLHIKALMPDELELDEGISGYSSLVKILPIVTTLALITMPFYIWGFHKVRTQFPNLTTLAAMSMILVLVIPSAGALWGQPIYLFICGFGLFPLFILFSPVAFQTLQKEKSGARPVGIRDVAGS